MTNKLSRRRLLVDALGLGGVLLGAALLTRPQPLFSQFLEGQETPTPAQPSSAPPKKVPVKVKRSPQAPRYDCTCAYPSDSDHQLPRDRLTPEPSIREQSLLPLWARLG